jgi:hypothetical protein
VERSSEEEAPEWADHLERRTNLDVPQPRSSSSAFDHTNDRNGVLELVRVSPERVGAKFTAKASGGVRLENERDILARDKWKERSSDRLKANLEGVRGQPFLEDNTRGDLGGPRNLRLDELESLNFRH